MNKLDIARKEIEQIDAQMALLFEKRMAAVKEVARYKFENRLPVYDAQREALLIEKNTDKLQNKELSSYYVSFMHALMDISKNYQRILMDEMHF